MKTIILSILVFVGTLTAQAQTTNVTVIRYTYDVNGITNNTTENLSQRESDGFVINFNKDVQTALQLTNPPPTFQNSIKQTGKTFLLTPLAEQARANDRKTNKVDLLFLYGPAFWDSILTSQQRQALKDIASAPNVATNFPAQ